MRNSKILQKNRISEIFISRQIPIQQMQFLYLLCSIVYICTTTYKLFKRKNFCQQQFNNDINYNTLHINRKYNISIAMPPPPFCLHGHLAFAIKALSKTNYTSMLVDHERARASFLAADILFLLDHSEYVEPFREKLANLALAYIRNPFTPI